VLNQVDQACKFRLSLVLAVAETKRKIRLHFLAHLRLNLVLGSAKRISHGLNQKVKLPSVTPRPVLTPRTTLHYIRLLYCHFNFNHVRLSLDIKRLLTYLLTYLTAFFPGQPPKAGTIRKAEPFWILLRQEMMGWKWHQLDQMQVIYTSLQTDNHGWK